MPADTSNKILSREKLQQLVSKFREEKKVIGFTSGAFDLLHAGHVDYLEKARAQCDVLIVAVNSNASIKMYKDEKRPVRDQSDRARLIAALSCVDYVFIFQESNNNVNVQFLKPAIYFKAEDYKKDKLSSAPLVEAYGGRVVLIPLLAGFSSSSIIEDIIFRFHTANTSSSSLKESGPQKAVFIDRDGTINESIEYLHEAEKFKLIPNAMEALKRFKDLGFKIVIVTNQPGIGMGYFTKEDYFKVNKELLKAASSAGVDIDRIYFCPHSKGDGCSCRKPKLAMIERAVADLRIDLSKSFVIGDMTSDIQLGKNAGCRTILVETGEAGKDGKHEVKPDFIARDLLEASEIVLNNSSR